METKGIAFHSADGKPTLFTFERRNVGENDVHLEVLYAGICHSDIHTARNEWGGTKYPTVPGHEILGKVVAVGSQVNKFKVGDLAGVGCMVDSCRSCKQCEKGTEQFCKKGCSMTYNSTEQDKKTVTQGGYSTQIVVTQDFCLRISDKFKDLKGVAPLLCAGITTYSPIHKYKNKTGPGCKVGVIGLGGLGHMAIKFLVAMGAEVTVFSTSPSKEEDAKKMGAHHFVVSKDQEAMKKLALTFDFLMDTVSANHPIQDYINLLDIEGVIVVIGAPPKPYEISSFSLLMYNRTVLGSLIGGIAETQEMLDYCADHGIICDYELVTVDDVEKAYERTIASDVKYRFVIDIETLKNKN